MTPAQRKQVMAVMACHFIAAMSALGMPPFFAVILSQGFQSTDGYLVGWFYILPTLCTALAAPWWGRFADRRGQRTSLLRAQLGLALGFALASAAPSPGYFALALVVQGLLGGTFAASNGYLATLVQGPALAQSLNWMQGSARASLVVAPVLFGWLMAFVAPLELYRYLVLLPLLAAALVLILPAPASAGMTTSAATGAGETGRTESVSFLLLCALQFGFSFACVISFPYFIADMQSRFAGLDTLHAAWLFSLPHLIYLLSAHWLGNRLRGVSPWSSLPLAFGLLALSMWGQYQTSQLAMLTVLRVVMGVAMTAGFVALHQLMSTADRRCAGRFFGWLDAASKWAGVAAGLSAGVISSLYTLSSPLLVAAVTLAALSGWLSLKCHLIRFLPICKRM